MAEFQLNSQQKQAVDYSRGPLLIIAGAGTGKTTVITERIKWLIEEKGLKPEEILALTFTEKAAFEMEERVDVALPLGYARTWIMTFHGFCERVLRQDGIQIGLDPGFRILSEAEAQLFLRDRLFELDLTYFRPQGNPTKFLGGLITHFSRLKDEDVTPGDYVAWASSKFKIQDSKFSDEDLEKYQELAHAYEIYERLKVQNSVMDFADLIANTLRLFRERPNVLADYQRRFKQVLIDEFQDTNYVQNHLAIMLAGDDQQITAVADDDQSIYRWRGAAVYNVLDFQKHFHQAKLTTLTKNYRSDQRILDAAYQLIQHNNPDRLEIKAEVNKRLFSQVGEASSTQAPLQVIWAEKVEGEADQVVNQIQEIEPAKYSDVAILVRANNHAEPFVKALSREGIPYQFLGPGKLFRQAEIKELIAYLKVLNFIEDDLALYRVLSMPIFNLRGRDLAWLTAQAKKKNLPLIRVVEKTLDDLENQDHGMSEASVKTLQKVIAMLYRHLDRVNKSSPGELLYYFLEDTGQLVKMKDSETAMEAKQVENISAFFNKIKTYETQNPEAQLADFLDYLDFIVQAGESPVASEIDWTSENAVNILTVHSAKGLEFEYVFLVNLVDLRFPTINRKDKIPLPEELIQEPAPSGDPHIAEERRLFYVGLTRARKKVYLTGAKFYHDSSNLGKTARPKKISAFVSEALGENLEQYRIDQSAKTPTLFDLDQFKTNEVPSQKSPAKPVKVNYLSFSQIESFKTCPLHYKLDYILKVPKLPVAPLAFGTVVHDTLRDVYAMVLDKSLVVDSAEELVSKALEIYQQRWSSVGYESKEQEREYQESGRKILRDFLKKDFAGRGNIIRLEEPFTFNILTDPDLKVGGRIDRIDQTSSGEYEIIDYKTGQMPDQRRFKDKQLQLAIYGLAAVSPVFNYPLDKLKLSFYYLEENEKVTIKFTPADLEKAKAEIIKVRDEIEQSDFACSHSYICERGCEYSLFCD